MNELIFIYYITIKMNEHIIYLMRKTNKEK